MEREPLVDLSPGEELELAKIRLRMAELDEEETCFAHGVDPKTPHAKEEPVTDELGEDLVDVQRDTPIIDPL